MRFVYNLQDPQTSEDSDDPDSESDESTSSRRVNRTSRRIRSGKQRMSIVNNKLYNVPRPDANGNGWYDYGCGWHGPEVNGASNRASTAKRRFFQSAAQWDDQLRRVTVVTEGLGQSRRNIAEVMEIGGHSGEQDMSEVDEMSIDEEEGES